jgi:hypothetical protein
VAHRLTALLAVIKRQQRNPGFYSGKGDLYCGCIEGAYIMLRVFIEFLGVESSRAGGQLQLVQRTRQMAKNQKQARDTDVMLDCFGLPLVPLSDFRFRCTANRTRPRWPLQINRALHLRDKSLLPR